MLKKEIASHVVVFLIFWLLIALLKWHWGLPVLAQALKFGLFGLGGILGTIVLDFDQFFFIWTYPQEGSSMMVVNLWKQRRYKEALFLTAETARYRTKLMFHNSLMQGVMVVLAFWVITSSTSMMAKGLVLGMLLHLLKDEVELLRNKKEDFLHQLLWWPVKAEINNDQQKLFVVGMGIVFGLLSVLV